MSTTSSTKYNRILIGIDDSPPANWALGVGQQLAEQLGARILLVHVIEPDVMVTGDLVTEQRVDLHRKRVATELLENARERLPENVAVEITLRRGFAPEEIAAAAKEWAADLIVIGTHGRGRLAQFFLGSTADAVIRRSTCPVVAVAHDQHCNSAQQSDWVGVGSDCADPCNAHNPSSNT